MSNTLGIIQRAMNADTDLVRVIAENIANAQTAGYQRKIGVLQTTFSDATEALGNEALLPRIASPKLFTDHTPGTLSQTHEALDVALSGPGSLVASSARGETFIRGGHLHIDAQGQLVTQQGDAVLGVSGPITFTGAAVDAASISITADGTIRVAGNSIGQLRVESSTADSEQGAPRVLQGFLESSNVESVTEMVKLMETIRHFEATQRAARSYDGLLQQAISDLGKI